MWKCVNNEEPSQPPSAGTSHRCTSWCDPCTSLSPSNPLPKKKEIFENFKTGTYTLHESWQYELVVKSWLIAAKLKLRRMHNHENQPIPVKRFTPVKSQELIEEICLPISWHCIAEPWIGYELIFSGFPMSP